MTAVDVTAPAAPAGVDPGDHSARPSMGIVFWISVGWIALVVAAAVLADVLQQRRATPDVGALFPDFDGPTSAGLFLPR